MKPAVPTARSPAHRADFKVLVFLWQPLGGGVFGYLRDLLKAFENHALEGAGERPVSPSRIIFMNNQLLCSAREKCYFRHFWQQ